MTDMQLFTAVLAVLDAAIAADASLSALGLVAARNYQPRQQGANSAPTLYFVKLFDHRYGWTQKKDVYNAGSGEFDHTEGQQYEVTLQFMANVPQDPSNPSRLSESDVLSAACAIMQSDSTIFALRAQGIGVQRVTDVRNPYIVDDRDRFAAMPSFDVVLTHNRTQVSTTPAVSTYELHISRV